MIRMNPIKRAFQHCSTFNIGDQRIIIRELSNTSEMRYSESDP